VAANNGGGSAVSGEANLIKIGQHIWKIGEPIYSIGTKAVTKRKMVETFGAQWDSARVEGILLGKASTKKVRIRWTNLKNPEEMEYGFAHNLFADLSVAPRKKATFG
jgi:hypothetical protein